MSAESSQAQTVCPSCGMANVLEALHCTSCHTWLADALLSEPLARRIGLEMLDLELTRQSPAFPDAQAPLTLFHHQVKETLLQVQQQTRAELVAALTSRHRHEVAAMSAPPALETIPAAAVSLPPTGEAPSQASALEAEGQQLSTPTEPSLPTLGNASAALPKLSLPPSLSLPPKLSVRRLAPELAAEPLPEQPQGPLEGQATFVFTPRVQQPKSTPVTPIPPRPRRTFQLPETSGKASSPAPTGWEVLQRMRAEHVVWGLGVLLTLVGSFYFVGSRWGSFSILVQDGILLGGGLLYSGAFLAIGRLLAGRPGLELASRVMATVSLALWPALALPVGGLGEHAPVWGLLALSLAAGIGWVLQTRAIQLISPADVPTFARVYLPLSLLPALLPTLQQVQLAVLLPLFGIFGLYRALFIHNISEGRERLERSWALALSVQAFGVVCALTLSGEGVETESLLPLLPLLGAGAFYLDLALGRWKGMQRLYFKEPPGIFGLLLTVGGVLASLGKTPGLSPLLTQLFGGLVLGLVALLYRARWLMLGVQGIMLVLTLTLGKALGIHLWLARGLELPASSGQLLALSLLPGLALLLGIERLWQKLERPQFAEDTLRGALAVSSGIGLLAVGGPGHWPWLITLPGCAATCLWVFTRTAHKEPLQLAWIGVWLFVWRSLGALELPPALAIGLALGADALGTRLTQRTFLPLGETARALSVGGLGVGLALSLGVISPGALELPSAPWLALNLSLLSCGMATLAFRRHPSDDALLKGATALACLTGVFVPLSHTALPAEAGSTPSGLGVLALTLGSATLLGVALIQEYRRSTRLEPLENTPTPVDSQAAAGSVPWASPSFTLGLSGILSILAWMFLPGAFPDAMTKLRSLLSPWAMVPQPLTLAWLAFFFWPLTVVWLGVARALEHAHKTRLHQTATLGLGAGLAVLGLGSVLAETPLPSLLGLPLLFMTAWGLSSDTRATLRRRQLRRPQLRHPQLGRPQLDALTGLTYALGILLVLQTLTALHVGLANKTLVLTLIGVGGLEWSVRRPDSSRSAIRRVAGLGLLWLTLTLTASALLLGVGAHQLPLALAILGAGMAWSASRARLELPHHPPLDEPDAAPATRPASPASSLEKSLNPGGWLISLGAVGLSVLLTLLGDGGWMSAGAALLSLLTALSSSLGLRSRARLLLFYPLVVGVALSVARADPVAAARNEALVAQALGFSSGTLPLGWISLAVLGLSALGLTLERSLPGLETLRQRVTVRLTGSPPAEPLSPPSMPWLEPIQADLLGGAQWLLLGLLATFSTPGVTPAVVGLPLAGGILLWCWHRKPWPATILALQAVTALWVWALLERVGTPLPVRLASMSLLSFGYMEVARRLQPDGLHSTRAALAQGPLAGLGRAGVWVSLLAFAATTVLEEVLPSADPAGHAPLLSALLAAALGAAWNRWARLDRHPLVATVSVGLWAGALGLLGQQVFPRAGRLELALLGGSTLLTGMGIWRTLERETPIQTLRARLWPDGKLYGKRDRKPEDASTEDIPRLLPQGLFSRALWRLGWLATWASTLTLLFDLPGMLAPKTLEPLMLAGLTALGLGLVAGLERSSRAAWSGALLLGAAGVGAQTLSGSPGFWIPALLSTGMAGAVLAGAARWLGPSSSLRIRSLLAPGWKVSCLGGLMVLGVTGQTLLEGTLPDAVGWGTGALLLLWGSVGSALTHAFWPSLAPWLLAGVAGGVAGFQGTIAVGVALGMGVAALLLLASRAGVVPWLSVGIQRLARAGDGYSRSPLEQPETLLLHQPLQLGLALGALYQVWGLTSPEVGVLPALAVGIAGLAGTGALLASQRAFLLLPLPALVAWQAGVHAPYCIVILSLTSLGLSGLSLRGWQKIPAGQAGLLGSSTALVLALLHAAGLGTQAPESLHAALNTPMLPVVLGCWTVTLAGVGRHTESKAVYLQSGLGLWATLGAGLAWVGTQLGNGRPALALLPPWGVGMMLLTVGILVFHARLVSWSVPVVTLRRLYDRLAWLTLLGALLLPQPKPLDLVLSCVGWMGLSFVSYQTGMAEQRVGPLRWAGTALVLAWGVIRFVSPLRPSLEGLDVPTAAIMAGVTLVAGELLFRQGRRLLAEVLFEGALILPGIFLIVCGLEGQPLVLPLAGAGALYLVQFHLRERVRVLLVGLVLLNSALLLGWMKLGLTDAQLYVVPLSLTSLGVAQKFRTTLPRAALRALRTGAMALIFLASFYQSVLTPWSSAVMLLLALGSVGAGVGLKVRSFVTLGAVSVGIVLGMNLLRFGLAFPQFWALYLTLAGISILGGMVGISMQKDRLRATLERLQSELEGWE